MLHFKCFVHCFYVQWLEILENILKIIISSKILIFAFMLICGCRYCQELINFLLLCHAGANASTNPHTLCKDKTFNSQIAVITVKPSGKASFVDSMHRRLIGQYNETRPITLAYVFKTLITV